MKNYRKEGPVQYMDEVGYRPNGSHLKALRERRGYTQKYVAERLYTNQQTVSRHESGIVMPEAYFILAYASLYGVTTDEIFYGK